MQTKMLIGGQLQQGQGEAFTVFDPATGAEIARIPEASPAQVAAAELRQARQDGARRPVQAVGDGADVGVALCDEGFDGGEELGAGGVVAQPVIDDDGPGRRGPVVGA